ncbi:MAG: radical SAM protein, partial [Spirochaetaceae bacterium]|nr:radical SAM protein [Spirochaetaceae bacterium]
MLPIAFQTLGCKLNQCETGSIAAAFANAGFPVVADAVKAGLLVVNTCAVTSKAEQKGRRMIRAALNRNPLCSVIVTGCGAGADMAGIEVSASGSSERRVFLIPGTQKSRVMDIPLILAREGAFDQASLRAALERFCGAADGGTDASSAFRFEAAPAGFRSRYFLKIQDGCDNSCAYCLVRVARGPAKSLSAEEALRRLRAAEADGAAEAVLTGVNIGQWNKACGGLPVLLKSLLAGTNRIGLRLSSLEPDIFTEDFFAALENPRVRPHFHLSIQSGSLNILKRMGRHYGPEAALGAIGRLRSVKKDPFIACDIITGFPGETERDFRETL